VRPARTARPRGLLLAQGGAFAGSHEGRSWSVAESVRGGPYGSVRELKASASKTTLRMTSGESWLVPPPWGWYLTSPQRSHRTGPPSRRSCESCSLAQDVAQRRMLYGSDGNVNQRRIRRHRSGNQSSALTQYMRYSASSEPGKDCLDPFCGWRTLLLEAAVRSTDRESREASLSCVAPVT
jgi:hypothetical protein